MPPIPALTAQQTVDAFRHHGWEVARSGNHIILVKEGHRASLSVPNHREVARGTLRALIRLAGLAVEEFLEAL